MAISDNAIGIVSDMSFVDVHTNPSRVLRLSGSGLPFRGIVFGGSNKMNVQEYQGSNYAHIQIINPSETMTPLKGKWHGRLLDGVNGEIEYGEYGSIKKISEDIASDNFQAMMNFCKWMDEWRASGQLFTFSWFNIFRRGVVDTFEYEIIDTNEIGWSMTIRWESYKNVEGSSKITKIDAPASIGMDWAAKIKDMVGALEQMLGLDPLQGAYGPNIPIVSDIFDCMRQIDEQNRRLNDVLSSAEKMNELLAQGAFKPMELIGNILNTVSNAQATFDRMENLWSQNAISSMQAIELAADNISQPSWTDSVPGTASGGDIPEVAIEYGLPSGNLNGFDGSKQTSPTRYNKVLDEIKAGVSAALDFDVREIIFGLKAESSEAIERLKRFSYDEDNILDIFIADDEMHIGSIAVKYYGKWDKWPQLADYNGIVSPLLDAGRMVVIPRSL